MIDAPKTASSTELLKAAIGEKNQAYYLHKFEQFDEDGDGLHASWNWAAFFFTGLWALYRKMYAWFFVILAFAIIVNMAEKINTPSWVVLLLYLPFLGFAVYGNSLYYRKVKAQIANAQESNTDDRKVIRRLNASSGVLKWVPYVFGAIPVIGIVAAIAIPAFQNKTKFEFDSSTAKPWDRYSSNEKPEPVETDWAKGTITPPPQNAAATQNSQIETFLIQPPKANPFDQFDEKSSQNLAPKHLAKREIILEKLRLNEVLKINGVATAGMPQNATFWSTSSALDLERNQTPWRDNKTQFNTHVVNKTQNKLSGIGFDFKESDCADSAKSNRFFVNLDRSISAGSSAVVTFMMPESLVNKGGNFCLDIISAWN